MNRRQFLKQSTTATLVASAAPAVLSSAVNPTEYGLLIEGPSHVIEGETAEIAGWVVDLNTLERIEKAHLYINGRLVGEINP